jgi:hypothetical protein
MVKHSRSYLSKRSLANILSGPAMFRRSSIGCAGNSSRTSQATAAISKEVAVQDLRGSLYSLNYDLLLYWTLLHEQIMVVDQQHPLQWRIEETERIEHNDGFLPPDDDPEAQYVTWDGEESHEQCVFFLHGGLHLFDHGAELQKKCWERSGGLPLVDQIRSALNESKFPLFVSEGNSAGKFERIRHSAYLHKGLRSFRGNCNVKKTAYFYLGILLQPTTRTF